MALELRHLRYVERLGATGSFSRAAMQLGIAQSTLSQQIAAIERELGLTLFERHPRGATVTEAGEEFLSDARATLAAFDATVSRAARRANGEVGTLDVGFTASAALDLTPPILSTFTQRHPRVDVRVREFPLPDPSAGLADGRSDVAFVRPPLGAAGLWFEPLLEEPRVVAVAERHRLAHRTSVTVDELLDEPMIETPGGDPVWEAFWLLDDHRDGARAPIAASAETLEAEMQLVAAGRAVSITCGQSGGGAAYPGVRFVPVDGIAPSTVALAYGAGTTSPLVRDFVAVAREVRGRSPVTRRPLAGPA